MINSSLYKGIDCGLLEVPKNGDISFSQGTFFRSVAMYNCDAPFQLVGSVTRVCQNNMEWSGEAPICECKHSNKRNMCLHCIDIVRVDFLSKKEREN